MGLVLTRHLGEGIVVDGKLLIKIVKIGKGQVRLYIHGPREDYHIDRLEEVDNAEELDNWGNRDAKGKNRELDTD